jgi:hypothetical protein
VARGRERGRRCRFVLAGVAVTAACAGWIAFCGFQWGWGPCAGLHDVKTAGLPGNAERYSLENVELDKASPLRGRRIAFLRLVGYLWRGGAGHVLCGLPREEGWRGGHEGCRLGNHAR